jgi:hypothetical protein
MPEIIPSYFGRFRQPLRDEAETWARDNIWWAAAMVIVVPVLIYVATGKAQEWIVLWWSVVAYATIFLCYVLAHAVITPIRLDRELRRKLRKAQNELECLKDGSPTLVCKGVSFHENPIVTNLVELTGSPPTTVLRRELIGVPVFYHLSIVNEPRGMADRKVAEKVAARVRIFHEDGTPAADERLHRWEHSPGPAEVGKEADQKLPLDIPPSGIECKLDIAMKYDDEDEFYTPNNETALRGVPGWRDEEFKFPPGTYIAEIHFRGTNVVSDLRCRIKNKGKGERLEIELLSN